MAQNCLRRATTGCKRTLDRRYLPVIPTDIDVLHEPRIALLPFRTSTEWERMHDRVSPHDTPACDVLSKPAPKLRPRVAFQLLDLRCRLGRATNYAGGDQMCAGRSIPFARLAQHDGVVHRT